MPTGEMRDVTLQNYRRRGRLAAYVAIASFGVEFISYGFRPNVVRNSIILGSAVLLLLSWGVSVWNYARTKGYSYGAAAALTLTFPVATLVLPFFPNLDKVKLSDRSARREEERRKTLGY